MADIKMEIKGMAELRQAMLALPPSMDRKILNSVLMPGAAQVRDEARRLAPVLQKQVPHRLAGVLKRNIRMASAKPVPGMTATVIIGVRKFNKAQLRRINKVLNSSRRVTGKTHTISATSIIGNPFYWRFMEFGYTDRAGKFHGPHGGQGFLRPAFNARKESSLVAITDGTRRQVEKVGKRLGFTVK